VVHIFGNRNKPEAPVKSTVTRPDPMEPMVAPEGYLDVAKKLGLVSRATLISFLQREEIPCYDLNRVVAWMDSISDRQIGVPDEGDIIWGWFPLRAQDLRDRSWSSWVNGAIREPRRYDKAVPAFALKAASTIVEEFPEARLLVADREVYRRRNSLGGDPFLAALLEGSSEPVPFAVWDEPGF